MDDMKNLKSFVVPETVSRPSSLREDWEFRTNYRCKINCVIEAMNEKPAIQDDSELSESSDGPEPGQPA